MTTKGKVFCEGSNTGRLELRTQASGGRLAKCNVCDRVLRPRADNTLRPHQVKGRTTASMDSTMDILWGGAQ